MKGPIRYMATNHVAANILMLFFIVGGLLLLPTIKQEIFPEVSLDTIMVSVAYPGAAPEEVEDGVVSPIEDSISQVDGIKEIKGIAAEGLATVLATVKEGSDPDIVLQDIKNAVDRIVTFPEDAEKPIISKLLNRRQVLSVVLYGQVDQWTLRHYAERIKNELLKFPQITQVELGGVRPYEISVEVPEEVLRKYGLTLEAVAAAIRRASQDVPGGTIKTQGGHILIRTKGKRYWADEYRKIVVLARADGTRITLGDIARVEDGFADVDTHAEFDSMPAVMIKVYRVGNQKPIEISDLVKEYLAAKEKELPTSLHMAIMHDTSRMFRSRIRLLLKNAALGLVLVFVTLGLFLEIRLALWVMLGIPVSFCGAFLLMPGLGLSINMISLFAFIMALGIVVDDAIVVGESVYSHRSKGKGFVQAAIDGALEVGGPVIFSVLTTIVAFIPLIFVKGMIGKFIKVIPLVVISILTISLVESLLVLPAHLAGQKRLESRGRILGAIEAVRSWFGGNLEALVNGPYRRLLTLCLHYRYTTLAVGVAILLLALGLVRAELVRFRFMPAVDGDEIKVSIELPVGAPVDETERIADLVARKGRAAVEELERRSGTRLLRHVYTVVGGGLERGGPVGGAGATGSHLAGIDMLLVPAEEREITSSEIGDLWRSRLGPLPGVESLVFRSNLVHMGANIDIQLIHDDMEVLKRASKRLKAALARFKGVSDIEDSYSTGKLEFKIHLKPRARLLGITEADLGRQLRAAFYGAEALRIQRERSEVKVLVKYPEPERRHIKDLFDLRLRTPGGGEIPLREAAEVTLGRGFSTINRFDRRRVVDVTASVDAKVTTADDVIAGLERTELRRLQQDFPGLTYGLEGENREEAESMESMRAGFLLALLGIFSLLAVSFKSYFQPIIIMCAIPFGIVGAILGHLIMGYDLSILSMFGLVALSGVVVNDSLLLIDFVNGARRRGQGLFDAVVAGGVRRFRPILLTSLTTFFGLTPMIMETSVQAQFLIPMAISLGFGILFATGITLFLIPCLYLVYEDMAALLRRED